MRLRQFYPASNLKAYDPMSKTPVSGGIQSEPGGIQYEIYDQAGAVWVVRWGARNSDCPKDSSEKTAYIAKYNAIGVAYIKGGQEAEAMARELADKNPLPKEQGDDDEEQSPRRRKTASATA